MRILSARQKQRQKQNRTAKLRLRITGNMNHKHIMRHEKLTKSLTMTHNILRYFDDFLDNQ